MKQFAALALFGLALTAIAQQPTPTPVRPDATRGAGHILLADGKHGVFQFQAAKLNNRVHGAGIYRVVTPPATTPTTPPAPPTRPNPGSGPRPTPPTPPAAPRVELVIELKRVVELNVNGATAEFSGPGLVITPSNATPRPRPVPVKVTIRVVDGGTTGPDTYSIKAVKQDGTVVYEASGDVARGQIGVHDAP